MQVPLFGSKLKNPVTWIFILAFAIYVGMFLLTPLQNDDVSFIHQWKKFCGGTDTFSFETYKNFIFHIRRGDNSRLSNILYPLSGMFSPGKEVFPFLASAMICLIMWLVNKLSFATRLDSYRLVVIWFILVLFLPWRAHLFEVDYALNYIFAGAVTLGNLYLLTTGEQRGWTVQMFGIVAITCILSGAWHEGFAVPTLAGLGMLLLVKRFRFSWQWYFLIAVYFVSTLIFGLSPGMIARFNREVGTEESDLLHKIADLSMCILVIGSVLLFSLSRRGRSELMRCFKTDYFTVCSVAMLTSGCISLGIRHTAMTSFYPQLLATICIFILYKPWILGAGKKMQSALVVVGLTLLLIQSGSTLMWDYRFFIQDKEIKQKLQASQTGTVFHDVIMPWEVPAIPTLYFPSRISYALAFHINSIVWVTDDKNFALVPTALKHVDLSNAEDMGDGIFRYKGCFVSNVVKCPDSHATYLDVELSDGTVINHAYALVQEFQTEDGQTYTYIQFMLPEYARISHIHWNEA